MNNARILNCVHEYIRSVEKRALTRKKKCGEQEPRRSNKPGRLIHCCCYWWLWPFVVVVGCGGGGGDDNTSTCSESFGFNVTVRVFHVIFLWDSTLMFHRVCKEPFPFFQCCKSYILQFSWYCGQTHFISILKARQIMLSLLLIVTILWNLPVIKKIFKLIYNSTNHCTILIL